MKKLPIIFIISIGFGILAVQYFDSAIIGAAIAILVSILMINDLEQDD